MRATEGRPPTTGLCDTAAVTTYMRRKRVGWTTTGCFATAMSLRDGLKLKLLSVR